MESQLQLSPENKMKDAIEKSSVSRQDFHLDDKVSFCTHKLLSQGGDRMDELSASGELEKCRSRIVAADIAFGFKMPVVHENDKSQVISETSEDIKAN